MKKITSKDNDNIKLINALNSSAKYRKKNKAFLLEGFRLCSEIVNEQIKPELLCVSEGYAEKYNSLVSSLEDLSNNAIMIPDSLFEKISDTKSPQGIICVCKSDILRSFTPQKTGKYVALENVSDPLNLGTVIRTAEALNVNGLILSKDCCDVLSPKVVRGSMGAVLRMSFIFVDSMADYVLQLNEMGFDTFASVVQSDVKKITDINFKDGSVVLIGNEGNGLTKETVDACKEKITIPMNGRAESLNAAAAASIVMWELVK